MRFDDAAITPATRQQLDIDKLTFEGISTAPNTSGKLSLAAKLNRKADLQANGSLQLEPLATKLNLNLRGIELLPLQPYFGDRVNLTVTKGQVLAKIDDSGMTIRRGDLQATVDGAFHASIVCYRPSCRTLNVIRLTTSERTGRDAA